MATGLELHNIWLIFWILIAVPLVRKRRDLQHDIKWRNESLSDWFVCFCNNYDRYVNECMLQQIGLFCYQLVA